MHPINITVSDDLERSRLTVFFRLLLLIPHLVWLFLWTIAAYVCAILGWFATLATGQLPDAFHAFLSHYLRYRTHVYAYGALLANPFPGFTGEAGSYPVDVEIAPPAPQDRLKTGFRIVLAIPALLLGATLTSTSFGGGAGGGSGKGARRFSFGSVGLIGIVAFLGWWVSLFTGRMAPGMRDAGVYCLQYGARVGGYGLLVCERYPDADPEGSPAAPLPAHPVTVGVTDDLARNRLTVFFRLLLALPHIVWLYLWSLLVIVLGIANWFATLIRGASPPGLHLLLAAYVRYYVHVSAYIALVANPFPGFTGAPGSYPVELSIAEPERQNRWRVLFRLFLSLPAALLSSGLATATLVAAFLGWWASLFTGRMPRQLRNLGAWGLRYQGQLHSYFLLLTERYPYSGPPA
jgi:hypothetical protein